MLLIIIELSEFEKGVEPERWVDDPDDAYQYHETRGKEVDDEFQGVLQIKGPDKCLNTEHEKKNGDQRDQDILPQPKTRAHGIFSLVTSVQDIYVRIRCQATLTPDRPVV